MMLKKVTNRKLLFLIFVFIFMLSSVSYAQVCEVDKAKDVLRKNLYLHITQTSSPLTLAQVKDLLVFYLGVPQGLVTVDCSASGSNSNAQLSNIVTTGETAPNIIPACSDGTKYGECSTAKPKYCYGSSLIHKCKTCGCPSGNSCNSVSNNCELSGSNITCFSNLDCGNSQFTGSYYCSDDYITRNYLNYTCINPGTVNSSCISSSHPVSLSYCNPSLNQTCVNDSASCQVTAPDTIAPAVSITAPVSGLKVNGSITVSATASDNVGVAGVQFKLDGANLGAEDTTAPYSTIWDTTTTTNDLHALTAVARDVAGNTNTSLGVTVNVSNPTNQNPVAIINYSLGTNLTVSFNGSLSYDLDGFIASYNWKFGDGSQSNLTIVIYTYPSPGLYLVNLTVEDNLAAANSKSQLINVT